MSTFRQLLLDWLQLARSPRARPFILITLFVDAAFIFVFLVAIQSYLVDRHNANLALPGYTLAAYGAAKLAAQLFAGRLIDRLGSTRAAQLGVAIIVIGQLSLLAGAVTPAAVLPAAAVYGFGSAVLWPALFARASDRFPAGERAKLGSAMTLTTGVSLILGLGLGLALPARFPYTAATAIAFTMIVLAAAASAGLRAPATESWEMPIDRGPASLRAVTAIALEPRRLGFAMIVLLESAAVGGLQAVFRSYGRDLLGVSFRQELLYLAPAAIFGAGAVVVGGALADRLGRLPLLGLGFLGSGVSIWLLSGITSPAGLIPLAVLGGVGAGLATPSLSALSMDLSRTAGQGTVLAWFMTMEGLGHAGGSALGGWVNASVGTAHVLQVVATLFATVGAGGLLALGSGYLPQKSSARPPETIDPLAGGSIV